MNTFECYTCKQDKPVSKQVSCCGCEQQICSDCNDSNKCACDRTGELTLLVN
jgi:hypothetical protein